MDGHTSQRNRRLHPVLHPHPYSSSPDEDEESGQDGLFGAFGNALRDIFRDGDIEEEYITSDHMDDDDDDDGYTMNVEHEGIDFQVDLLFWISLDDLSDNDSGDEVYHNVP